VDDFLLDGARAQKIKGYRSGEIYDLGHQESTFRPNEFQATARPFCSRSSLYAGSERLLYPRLGA
jgi:hypothetical protein